MDDSEEEFNYFVNDLIHYQNIPQYQIPSNQMMWLNLRNYKQKFIIHPPETPEFIENTRKDNITFIRVNKKN